GDPAAREREQARGECANRPERKALSDGRHQSQPVPLFGPAGKNTACEYQLAAVRWRVLPLPSSTQRGRIKVFRISRSSVPWRTSGLPLLTCMPYRCLWKYAPDGVGCQAGKARQMWFIRIAVRLSDRPERPSAPES